MMAKPYMTLLWKLGLVTTMSWSLVLGVACTGDDDDDDDDDAANDDDAVGDDDDSVGDDDDSVPSVSTTISGTVFGTDRESGALLTDSQYSECAGALILYVLPDSSDLSNVWAKFVMQTPGDYSVTLNGYVGDAEVVAIVDENNNSIIDNDDVLRSHSFNPLEINGVDRENVDVYVDLHRNGFGNGNSCADTVLSGDVNIIGYADGPVAVTTNSADLSDGPWDNVKIGGAGGFAVDACAANGTASLLAYLDDDRNGFYEPSDPIGVANGNPYVLGIGDVAGIQIDIPSAVPVQPPAPNPLVGITGTVTYGAFATGDILVFASAINTEGTVYSQAVLAAPGAFNLIAPNDATDILVWAAADEDGDGEVDVYVDPFDSQGPLDPGNGVSGIDLELAFVPPAPGSLSGTIDFAGTVNPGDCVKVAVFDIDPSLPSASPSATMAPITNPTFPVAWEIQNLPPASYWIGSHLDYGCDNLGSPEPGEPDGGARWPVLLPAGGAVAGIDLTLPE